MKLDQHKLIWVSYRDPFTREIAHQLLMKLKIWQVHHPHLQICPQLLSWSGETVGHREMKIEGKAPKGTQTHLGYFNFPQSVLGMNKGPEKSRNQSSQKNGMQSFQQLSPRKRGGNWREEKGRAVAVKANSVYIQECARKRKMTKEEGSALLRHSSLPPLTVSASMTSL